MIEAGIHLVHKTVGQSSFDVIRGFKRRAFEAGDSPSDFPAEGYEAQWPDRFATEQLNETGRRGLDLA